MGVLGSAGVHAAIEAAGLTDLEGANALVRDLPKLGVVTDDHLILQPLNLRLRGGEETFISSITYLQHTTLICYSSCWADFYQRMRQNIF